ncbi:unnamed protein product [Arctia plantaginis]|uniref:Uncharacterized protein n=1 Tax=Arctia plantaginis TaxID=874455 RepID=A0A8S1B8S5_ARCPL|nr:unnamed protein product [Arctia plantaginis]
MIVKYLAWTQQHCDLAAVIGVKPLARDYGTGHVPKTLSEDVMSTKEATKRARERPSTLPFRNSGTRLRSRGNGEASRNSSKGMLGVSA